MQATQIILRVIHIAAGVVWAGSAFFLVVFLLPSARAIGGQAAPLMVHMAKQRHLTRVIISAATLNVAAGLILYWRASHGLEVGWITSPSGLGFTVGAVCALTGYVIAISIMRPATDRVADIGEAVLASGGAPTPEQGEEMARMQERVRGWGTILLVLLSLAVVAMAASRYFY